MGGGFILCSALVQQEAAWGGGAVQGYWEEASEGRGWVYRRGGQMLDLLAEGGCRKQGAKRGRHEGFGRRRQRWGWSHLRAIDMNRSHAAQSPSWLRAQDSSKHKQSLGHLEGEPPRAAVELCSALKGWTRNMILVQKEMGKVNGSMGPSSSTRLLPISIGVESFPHSSWALYPVFCPITHSVP